MKNFYLLMCMLFLVPLAEAQTTSIPDSKFEQALIDLGYDSGQPDGSVVTDSISGILTLFVPRSEIVNLKGIEDFAALEILYCNNNKLTNLDVSANTALEVLDCNSLSIAFISILDLNNR